MTIIYLYVKQHSITLLKYFGKTIQNPKHYKGSGLYWKRHIKEHGRKHVVNVELWEFTSQEECSAFALEYSKIHDITNSPAWANLVDEDGFNILETRKGKPHTEETKRKISEASRKPRGPHSAERIANMSKSKLGKKPTAETRAKLSAAATGRSWEQKYGVQRAEELKQMHSKLKKASRALTQSSTFAKLPDQPECEAECVPPECG